MSRMTSGYRWSCERVSFRDVDPNHGSADWLDGGVVPIQPLTLRRTTGGGEVQVGSSMFSVASMGDHRPGNPVHLAKSGGSSRAPVPTSQPSSLTPAPPPAAPAVDPALIRQLEAAKEAYAAAAIEMGTVRERILASAEPGLLDLAAEIARSIIERELQTEPELHAKLARTALATLGDPRGSRLRASEEAFAAIVDAFGGPVIDHDGCRVEVTLDREIQGLGCIVENDEAQVDGRLQERLESVRRALRDQLRREQLESGE